MNYGFGYYVWLDCEFVIDVTVLFCFTENVISFECVHHTTFIGYVDSFHNVFHWANGVFVF